MAKKIVKKPDPIKSTEWILKKIKEEPSWVPARFAEDEEHENFKRARMILLAQKEVSDYIEKNGTKAFISERLRDGFIGELVHTANGTSYIQCVRGKPYGTVVAIKNGDDIAIGITYLDDEDMDKRQYPILGQWQALVRAQKIAKECKGRIDGKNVKSKARRQIDHFTKRALSFYFPDVYSHSRGQEGKKVEYKDYDEIHKRRAMILGEGK